MKQAILTKQATLLRACLIVIAIFGIANLAHAQRTPPANSPTFDSSGTGSIGGRVVLPSGQPVAGRVKINLSTLNDPGVTLYTDTNGNFAFGNLRPGTYYIEASSESNTYEPTSEQVRLQRGMRLSLVISLREKELVAKGKKPGAVVSVAELDPNVPSAAKKEYDRATGLANSGKGEEAVEAYKKALSIYPTYLVAHNDLGVQYLNLKKTAEAADEFGAAIEINPKAFNPRLNLGIALVEQERFLDAIEQLNQAVSIDSSAPSARLYLGIASAETDELEVAERELSLALSSGGPEYVIARYYLAHVHMKKGNRAQAVSELKAYLEKSPEGVMAARARQLLEKLND